MKRLILIRHGKAEKTPGKIDFERKLSEKGRKQLPILAKFLKDKIQGDPCVVLCSSSRRTRMTWKGINGELTVSEIVFFDDLYLAENKKIRSIINEYLGLEDVLMLIGHNDGISGLASVLADSYIHMSTSDAVVFEFDAEMWSEVSQANAVLRHHFSPQVLD